MTALDRLARLEAAIPPPPWRLALVVSRPDKAAGRGRKIASTPVALHARGRRLPLELPESANQPEFLAKLDEMEPDLFLVADYGEFLRSACRAAPRLGAYNLHASLLPKYRGAAPVAHAILNGETTTGVTLFRIEKKMDGGPIIDRIEVDILPLETAGELEARLAAAAADLLERALPQFSCGKVVERSQDEKAATQAPKLLKEQGAIPWQEDAQRISRRVRAMNPWPGAYSHLARQSQLARKGAGAPERIKFLRVRPLDPIEAARAFGAQAPKKPGETGGDGKTRLLVACGLGAVEVLELQRAGKAPLKAIEFLRGWKARPGDFFTSNL